MAVNKTVTLMFDKIRAGAAKTSRANVSAYDTSLFAMLSALLPDAENSSADYGLRPGSDCAQFCTDCAQYAAIDLSYERATESTVLRRGAARKNFWYLR